MKTPAHLVCIAWLCSAAVGCNQQGHAYVPSPANSEAGSGEAGGKSALYPWGPSAAESGASGSKAAPPAGGTQAMDPKPNMGDMGGQPAAPAAATGEARSGGAIAIAPDDSLALVVNRDVG